MALDPQQFHFFWSGPFSQWQHSEFTLDGVVFVTAEQAMMYFKALLFDDPDTGNLILTAKEPGKQKALGLQVRGFDEAVWDQHKCDIVRRINLAKFTQNKRLRRKLFQTGSKTLVEASPMDVVWGIGLDERAATATQPTLWPGQNLLGKILTEVRDQRAQEFCEEFANIDPT
ncbi:MAG: NADAR family protein [Pseudomonadota bacterium]